MQAPRDVLREARAEADALLLSDGVPPALAPLAPVVQRIDQRLPVRWIRRRSTAS